MSKPDKPYRKREVGGHTLSPETQMMSYGYDPKLSEMSIELQWGPARMRSATVLSAIEYGSSLR